MVPPLRPLPRWRQEHYVWPLFDNWTVKSSPYSPVA
jgi:hypothetical protein